MSRLVKIKDILTYLADNEIEFEFVGNENKNINGYSTLFNYKGETMTFVSTLNNFKDYEKLFEGKDIELIFTGFNESDSNKFNNQIKVEYPKRIFFSILERFYNSKKSNTLFSNKEDYQLHSFVSDNAR